MTNYNKFHNKSAEKQIKDLETDSVVEKTMDEVSETVPMVNEDLENDTTTESNEVPENAKEYDAVVDDGLFGTTTTYLNMRSQMSTDSNIVVVLPRNTVVKVINDNGEWLEVTYKNKNGYVLSKFITR